jgi:hypothetical protein
MRGVEVVDKDGSTRKISIAFRPRDGRFEVADAAIRNDPEFLPNVTELWNGTRPKPQLRRDLLSGLRDKGHAVDQKYQDALERNLDRAHSIADYRFPTVDIRKTATTHDEEATEEDVAEIFVRINNQGTRLGQADFVLTLLSVYHGELRDRIEERSRAMSLGNALAGLPASSPTRGVREPGADRIKERDRECLCLLHSRPEGRVPKNKLDELIARWVFGTLLTARYSGSSETMFEQDLARVARLDPADSDSFASTRRCTERDPYPSRLVGRLGDGTVHEGRADRRRQRLQGIAQRFRQTDRFQHDTPQFRIRR